MSLLRTSRSRSLLLAVVAQVLCPPARPSVHTRLAMAMSSACASPVEAYEAPPRRAIKELRQQDRHAQSSRQQSLRAKARR
jgi:hypothetical protein